MQVRRDENGAPFVSWSVPLLKEPAGSHRMGHFRAWVASKTGADDWAGSGRYLCVARVETPDDPPCDHATAFPLYPDNQLPEAQLLATFALSLCSIGGYEIDEYEE